MLEMRETDLAELHLLLSLYIRTYGTATRDAELLGEVLAKFEESQRHSPSESKVTLHNPRGAGRRSAECIDKAEVFRLRDEGKTFREIAQITSHSIGYVHKLIHERAGSAG